jgi:hypothetical protein
MHDASRKRCPLAALTGALLLAALSAAAQSDQGPLRERYEVTAGGFFEALDTQLELDAGSSKGTLLDLEKDLGAPDSGTVLRGTVSRRWGRHQVRVGYFQASRHSSRHLDRTIQWGDHTFNVGADVSTHFKTTFPEVDYTYWFLSNRKVAVGANLGLTLFGVQTTLDGTTTRGVSADRGIDTRVVVPLVGLEFRGQLAPWLLFKANGGYINDFGGSHVGAATAALEPHVYRAASLGLAYNLFELRSSRTGPLSWIDGVGRYRVSGLQLYARFAF